ncbi:MAG: hypothetical protein FGM16_06750 [Flavobacterium sp.]|nr:hypothetical protein [Flavobacterium sp.]
MKNREIKFRAWHLDDGMLYFDFDTFKKDYHNQYGNVMQFTGLYSTQGAEIYEGDIVMINHWKSTDLFDYKNPFVVEYYEGEINFKQGEYNNFKGSLSGKLDIEIIGNIYENPELL